MNKNWNAEYIKLMEQCWADDPSRRPSFTEIVQILETQKEAIGLILFLSTFPPCHSVLTPNNRK